MGGDRNYEQGQKDGSNNSYNPPVPIDPIDEIINSEETLNEWRELNDSYDKGWSNGYNQR